MAESQVIVLPNQRKNHRDQVALERKARNDSFVKRFVSLDQRRQGHFKPCALVTLARMIQPRQVCALGGHLRPRLGNHIDDPQPFNTAQVFARNAVQRTLNIRNCISGQFTLVLIFNLNRHRPILTLWFYFGSSKCRRGNSAESNSGSRRDSPSMVNPEGCYSVVGSAMPMRGETPRTFV